MLPPSTLQEEFQHANHFSREVAVLNNYKFCPLCGNRLSLKDINGKELLSCSSGSCDYVFWNNPVPVVTAIIEHEGNILLARNRTWPEKLFGLNTGFLEKDETPEQGIVREIKEELNLDAEIIDFIGVYSFFPMNQLLIAFHVRAHGTIRMNEEIAEIRHVPVEKLKAWPFGTGLVVQGFLEKIRKCETKEELC